jgi:hypothetical protein
VGSHLSEWKQSSRSIALLFNYFLNYQNHLLKSYNVVIVSGKHFRSVLITCKIRLHSQTSSQSWQASYVYNTNMLTSFMLSTRRFFDRCQFTVLSSITNETLTNIKFWNVPVSSTRSSIQTWQIQATIT